MVKRRRADGKPHRETRQERQNEKRETARESAIKLLRNVFFKQIRIGSV